jgi:hypothetical protein
VRSLRRVVRKGADVHLTKTGWALLEALAGAPRAIRSIVTPSASNLGGSDSSGAFGEAARAHA